MAICVVTVEEMRRAEKLSGVSAADLMNRAAEGIALHIEKGKRIQVVVGKGNNGGDGYATAVLLLQRGYDVVVVQVFPDEVCSPLLRAHKERFVALGGRVEGRMSADSADLILDALLGTGCTGKPEGVLEETIQAMNACKVPIIAIDIPSGLHGTTGEAPGVCVRAHKTIALGFPKLGFFIGKGWEHVGVLVHVDLGLKATPIAYLVEKGDACFQLPPIVRTRHKYEAGYVLACAGSLGMEGAAFLSAFAALRSGAGIVRLFHGEDMECAQAPWELIKETFTLKRFKQELKRASACFVGPGFGRVNMKKLLGSITLPCVVDADALYCVAKHPRWKLPQGAILTPHKAEMHRLLGKAPTLDGCSSFVEKKRVTLVLKGAPTFIFHPKTAPHIITEGTPGMATAGTGDVLTGIIAALLAQKVPPLRAALLGTWLHGTAGMRAEERTGPYSLVASDLLDALPLAFAAI